MSKNTNGNGTGTSKQQLGQMKRTGAAGMFLLATAVICIAAYQSFSHYAAVLVEREEADLLAVTEQKKAQIEEFLRDRAANAWAFAQRTSARNALLPPSGGAPSEPAMPLEQVIQQTRHAYDYRRIVLFHPDGRQAYPPQAANFGEPVQAGIRAALAAEGAEMVDLHRDAGGELVFGLAQTVLDAGKPIGVAYFEIDAASKLYPMVLSWPSSPSRTGETILIRRNGSEIEHISPHSHGHSGAEVPMVVPRRDKAPFLLEAKALLAPAGAIRDTVDYRGVPVLGAAAAIAGTRWVLISKIDVAEANADIRQLAWSVGILAGVFVLLAGTLSFLIWRSRNLEVAAEQAALARRYFRTIETSLDGYIRADAAGRIREANSAASDLTGYSLAELRRMTVFDVEAGLPREGIEEKMREYRAAGGGRFQTRWRRKDGGLVDVDISVSYPPDANGESFAYLRDITASLELTRRLQRLNRFYAFLTRVNHALADLRQPEEILGALCANAVAEGGFVLAWGGVVDTKGGRVKIVATSGEAADYARELHINTDPSLPTGQGQTGVAVRERRSVAANDFQNDPLTRKRREEGAAHHLRASAVTPILVQGKAVAAIGVYAGETGYFDAEMIALLEEAARSVALAWEAGSAARQRDLEREKRAASEERFQRIFANSPLATVVHSADGNRLLAINRAHERMFGYRLEEIADADAWFAKAYPDAEFRDAIRERWHNDIARARAGDSGSLQPPELAVRCRDGTVRIAQASLDVSGDDVIVSWTDLTDVRRGEEALRESERRFRGMVEQTITGFFVVRDDRIVYVNPRVPEMTGWSREELIGRDPLDFATAEGRAEAAAGRERLLAGEKLVSYTARARRKDGRELTLGINAVPGQWDGAPAIIAMAEDITERARNEEKIRDYVERLKTSMKGTLEAVARMVDLRDPYTAGHERHVGLIAAAIARELGWDEDRCRDIELAGLVHDIGKIAVPAEILAKPARLSPVEYDIIKNHAQAGYEILKDVKFNFPVADIIRQHHERLDGSGYPQGLKGDAILPEARVLAVADVIESMSAHRPYRPALGVEAGLAELEKNKGRLYDAAAVDALARLLREKNYQLPA